MARRDASSCPEAPSVAKKRSAGRSGRALRYGVIIRALRSTATRESAQNVQLGP
jgi:hypothetical protein